MQNILFHISKKKSGLEVNNLMQSQRRQCDLDYTFYFAGVQHPETPEQRMRKENRYTIVRMQTFFVNYYIDYSSDYWQSMIKELCDLTENLKWLSEYRLLFRKKFDKTFREEIKKNYIQKVLTHSVLGKDMAKKIVDLL
jgi:hypothetical protein